MSEQLRSEWINEGAGLVGVVLFNEEGKRFGGVVRPGETVWLTERERIATANAPRKAEDNPLTNGSLRCITPASEIANRRPIGEEKLDASHPSKAEPTEDETPEGTPPREERPATEETAAPPLPEGDPETGVRAPGEEVGTPEVVAQAGTDKRKPGSRGTTVKSGNPVAKPAAAPGKAMGVVVGQGGPQYTEQTA
jgi:hypothetical protein